MLRETSVDSLSDSASKVGTVQTMNLVVVVYLMESWESFCTEQDKLQPKEWPLTHSFPSRLMLKNSFTVIDSSKPSPGGRGPRQKQVRTVNRCGYWFRVSTGGSALVETLHFTRPNHDIRYYLF